MRSVRDYYMLQVQDEGSSAVMVRCSVHKASCGPLRLMSNQWFFLKTPSANDQSFNASIS
jgi:hypothetical protein